MNYNSKNKIEINQSTFGNTSENHSELGNENDGINSTTYKLYPVNNLPEKYRHIFSNYEYFNKIQTKAINAILHSDKPIVVSSPTGSGKTVIFELAIIRFLETLGKFSNNLENSKIIYVAPIKELCSELHEDWKNKFSIHGLKCVKITGDTEFTNDVHLLTSSQLIITTPEKWDSLTRKCKEFTFLLHKIKLFLVDEVHVINEFNRGVTLEAIVSRMKMIPKSKQLIDITLRVVAVSTTVANIEDIAKWLSSYQNYSADYFKSNEYERPVKLQKIVLDYDCKFSNFKFDLDLTYKLKSLITQYSNGQPTIIFCSTKKSVEFTCSILIDGITTSLCDKKQRCINEFLKDINNKKIKELIKFGIGCHHAGMSFQEKSVIENLFRSCCLNVLVTTSMLATGVNLSAHLVIIKSTEYYNFNGYKEYNECQVLQMIGRAGRPQLDTTATVIIMTKKSMKSRYEKILEGNQIVESHLHKHLIEQLNAEIFLGTIYNETVVMDWIRSTFLYVRASKSPQSYGIIRTHDANVIENSLQNLCLTAIKTLACTGLINFPGENNEITSKPEGEVMAKYSISFVTMKSYMSLKGNENLNDMIRVLASSKEFEIIKFKTIEKSELNILNKNILPNADSIRFPIEGGINTQESKINCLLQATLGTLKITSSSLAQDASKIIFISIQLTKALRELTMRGTKFEISRAACILAKCVVAKLWEQSKFVSKLIPKIGPVLSGVFVLNGKTTLQSIRDTGPRDIERFLHRNPPFGNQVLDFIQQIPKYKVQVFYDKYLELIFLKISLMDYKKMSKSERFHAVSILVGDSENRLLKAQQIRNEEFLEQEGVIDMTASLQNTFFVDIPDYMIAVSLISDQWVGIDVEIKFKPNNLEEHSKESMSEENLIKEPLLKTLSSPRPSKNHISRTIAQTKTEKTQVNIKKYLLNVPSKDQGPKIMNKLCGEKNKDTCVTNESSVATRTITDETIGTQINSRLNVIEGENEYFKFDKDDLNNYFRYDELMDEDVFSDLFVPDTNCQIISEAFDSAIEKCCFRENTKQKEYLKSKIRHEVIEPMQLQCPKDRFTFDRSENSEISMNDVRNKATGGRVFGLNEIKNINQYGRDQCEDKENDGLRVPLQTRKRVPFGVLQEGFACKKRVTQSTTSPTKALDIQNNRFTDVKLDCRAFSSRTRDSPENAGPEPGNTTIAAAAADSLTSRIETNLKASTDFYVGGPDADIVHSGRVLGGIPATSTAGTTASNRRSKISLDKYFRATKTPRRLPQSPNGPLQNLTKTRRWPSLAGPDGGDESFFTRRFPDRANGYDQTHSEGAHAKGENLPTLLFSDNDYTRNV